ECGSPGCGAWVRRAPASVGYGRLLADAYDAGPSRAGRSAARARHHDVTDGSAAARGSTADAVHALGETAVAPRRARGILGELRAAHRDHGAVIIRGALIPVVAGGIGVQRTGDAFAALASVGDLWRSGADVVVVARGPVRGHAGRRADTALAHGRGGAGGAGGARCVVRQIVARAEDVSRQILLATVELRAGVAIVAPAGVRMTGVARITPRRDARSR